MAILTGDTFYLEFNGVVFKGDYREFDPGIDYDTAEGTAGGDEIRRHTRTKLKVEPTGTFVVDDDAYGVAMKAVLKVGQQGNLIWGSLGNSAGSPKAGILAEVKKANLADTYDEEKEWDVEWINVSGSWVFDPNTATF